MLVRIQSCTLRNRFKIAMWRNGSAQLFYTEKVMSSNLTIATFFFGNDLIAKLVMQHSVKVQIVGSSPTQVAKVGIA